MSDPDFDVVIAAYLIPDLAQQDFDALVKLASHISNALRAPFVVGRHEIFVTAHGAQAAVVVVAHDECRRLLGLVVRAVVGRRHDPVPPARVVDALLA